MTNEKAKKDTRSTAIDREIYESVEAAVPLVSAQVGFKVSATQAVNYLLGKAVADLVG